MRILKSVFILALVSFNLFSQGKATSSSRIDSKAEISFGELLDNSINGEAVGDFDNTFIFTDENNLVFWEKENYWIRIRPTDYAREFSRTFVNTIKWKSEIKIHIFVNCGTKRLRIEHSDFKNKNDSLYLRISPLAIRDMLNKECKSLTKVSIEVSVEGKLKGKKALGLLTEWD